MAHGLEPDRVAGYPWASAAALAAPGFALGVLGALVGLETPVGLGLVGAGVGYLGLDIQLFQPRLERRASEPGDADRAAQAFLDRALDLDTVATVAAEFGSAVRSALGGTRAILLAPSADGQVQAFDGSGGGATPGTPAAPATPVSIDLGDPTAAFMWLGNYGEPLHRSQIAAVDDDGARAALALLDRCACEVALPLRHRGLLLGLGLVGATEGGPDTASFFRAMRAYTTVAIANTFLGAEARQRTGLSATFDLATAAQESLMPAERLVARPGWEIRGLYRPVAECGGDLWAWRELDDGRLLAVIADATGHGAAPALLAAVARGAIDAAWQMQGSRLDPARLLEVMGRAVHRTGRRRYLMTAFAFVLDPRTGEIRFANAGQNFPYVLAGSRVEALVARGNPLGLAPDTRYEVHTRTLEPGTKILLYTDGIVEAGTPHAEPFGERRFRTSVASLANARTQVVPDRLVTTAERYLGDVPVSDDITLVAIEYTPRPEPGAQDE